MLNIVEVKKEGVQFVVGYFAKYSKPSGTIDMLIDARKEVEVLSGCEILICSKSSGTLRCRRLQVVSK
jgi:hypothetical protein